MAIRPGVKWLVIAPTILFWAPCLGLFLATGTWLSLLYPWLGFYPGVSNSLDPGYSEIAMAVWSLLTFIGLTALGLKAIRRSSIKLAALYATFITMSSLLLYIRLVSDI
jgi:hypothetical protein